MDFDLDDPLGDLLSDDSNGSFFGGKTSKKTMPTAKEKVTANPKAKMADLFGVESETVNGKVTSATNDTATKSANSVSPATIHPLDQSKKPTIAQPQSQPEKPTKKEINFDDSDNILQELGFDPKHPRTPTGNTRKTNIINDLLDFSKSSRDTYKLEAPKNIQTTAESSAEKPANTETTTLAFRQSPSFGRPRTATRATAEHSTSDSLKFFSTPTKKAPAGKNDEPASVKSKINKPVAVDWLGINVDKEIAVDSLVTAVNDHTQPARNTKGEPNAILATANESPAGAQRKYDASTHLTQSLHQLDITTVHNEGALQSLKQQENQLRMASQMKQQESILIEMNTKQKVLLEQQERQFNELLQRQIHRQAALEESIQRQQEQIGSYMNILLAQPAIALSNITRNPNEYAFEAAGEGNNESTEKQMRSTRDFIELEAEVKRLELEKLRLEDVLQSVRSNHEQELDLIENSHK